MRTPPQGNDTINTRRARHRARTRPKPYSNHTGKPDLNTLRVWNGNEGPTLEQLVEAMPPKDGKFY